jgi:hypothetical protein
MRKELCLLNEERIAEPTAPPPPPPPPKKKKEENDKKRTGGQVTLGTTIRSWMILALKLVKTPPLWLPKTAYQALL